MKRAIFDYLRRWAWAYVLGFVLHVGAMVLALVKWDTTMIVSVFAGSGFVLMADIARQRGSRLMLSLPLTGRDVARVWRFVALEFPVLWYLLALLMAAGLVAVFGPAHAIGSERSPLDWGRFVLLLWLQTAALGVVFFVSTGLQQGFQSHAGGYGLWRSLRDGFFGLLWGGIVFALVMVWQYLPETLADLTAPHWTALAVVSLLGVAGWMRAETLVLKRLNFLKAVSPASHSRKWAATGGGAGSARDSIHAALAGPSGIGVSVRQFLSTNAVFGFLILGFNWLLLHHLLGGAGGGGTDIGVEQIGLFMPIFGMIAGIGTLTQLRVLGSLPMTKSSLAAWLVLWPLAVGAVFGLVAVVVHALCFGGTLAWPVFDSGLLACALLLVGLPVLLRCGFGLKALLLAFVLLPAVQILHVFRRDASWLAVLYLRGPWNLLVVTLIAAAIWWWCRRLLDASHPWREGAMRMRSQRRY